MKKNIILMTFFLFGFLLLCTSFVLAADTKAPLIQMWNPTGSPTYTTSSSISVFGLVSDQGGSGVKIVSVNGALSNANTGAYTRFQKTIYLPSKGTYGIIVVSYDFAGNRAEKRMLVVRQ